MRTIKNVKQKAMRNKPQNGKCTNTREPFVVIYDMLENVVEENECIARQSSQDYIFHDDNKTSHNHIFYNYCTRLLFVYVLYGHPVRQ